MRFISSDGSGLAPAFQFADQLPQVAGMNMPAPSPVSQVVPDDLGALMGLPGAPEFDARGGQSVMNHGDNLAEMLDENYLNKTGGEVLEKIKQYIEDREPWRERIERGMQMEGLSKNERDDGMFPGASTVVMSLMSEAVIHHWALGLGETWPSEGPAKAKVWGEQTEDKVEAAARVAEFQNYQMTFEDDDGYNEHSRLMSLVPAHGCAFKKIYEDADLDRTIGIAVEALDLIAPPRTTSLRNCPCYAHRFTRTENEIRRLVRAGFYRDADIGSPQAEGSADDETTRMRDEQSGTSAPQEEDKYTLFECYVELDVPGLEDTDERGEPTDVKLPYIVTIEEKSGRVLGFKRNWRESDKMKRARVYFVKYDFLPSKAGFYGIGLYHLLGGLQAAATGVLREMIDSGALASLQGGFVTKDGNLRGQRLVVEPGVWKPIDATSDQLSKAFFSPPFKEPSPTLFQLLGFLIGRGEKLIGTTDIQTGDNDAKAPVGSVIAILEQGAKVYTSIHRGYYNSMSDELRIRFELAKDKIGSIEGGVYPYDVDGHPRQIMAQDFGNGVAIQPTADPNIFSTSQRLALYQAVAQLALQAPAMFKGDVVAKRLLQAMKVPDYEELLAAGKPVADFDPVTENSRLMASLPVMAYPQQDHAAHIQVHTAFMQSPGFGGNPQVAQHILPAMIAHVGQHLAHANMQNFQKAGVPIPQVDPMTGDYLHQPPDTNQIAQASAQVAPQLVNAPGLPPAPGPQSPPPDPAAQAKAQAIAAESQQKQQLAEQSHQQALKHKEDAHQQAMSQTIEKARADQVKTAINIQTDQAKAAADRQLAVAKASHEQQIATQQAIDYATLTEAEKLQALRHEQQAHALDVAHTAIEHAHDRVQEATDAEQSRDIAEIKTTAEIANNAKKAVAQAKAVSKTPKKPKKDT
jgi:hypothetical protein